MSETVASICHMSLLNPAVHSRIFYKEALTQVKAGYSVSIIGQGKESQPYEKDGVKIVPFAPFRWLSMWRLFAPWKILWKAYRVKADMYQVHTPELLPITLVLWLLRLGKCKLVYDVHEDYYLNIRFGGYWPAAIRRGMAWMTRAVERFFARRMDGIVYAEDCFSIKGAEHIPHAYCLNKVVLPENPVEKVEVNSGHLRLIYTGTIARNWGILDAVELWIKLNEVRRVELVVAGYAQEVKLLEELHERVETSGLAKLFTLVGGATYVPHQTIVELIQTCSAGVGLYHLRENIKDRIPTKFYEFMGQGRPVLFTSNPRWNALNEQYDFGIPLAPHSWNSPRDYSSNHFPTFW